MQIEESQRKLSMNRNNHISEIDSQFEGSNYPSEPTHKRSQIQNHRETLPVEKHPTVPNSLRQPPASVKNDTMAYSEMNSPRNGYSVLEAPKNVTAQLENEMATKISALQE